MEACRHRDIFCSCTCGASLWKQFCSGLARAGKFELMLGLVKWGCFCNLHISGCGLALSVSILGASVSLLDVCISCQPIEAHGKWHECNDTMVVVLYVLNVWW